MIDVNKNSYCVSIDDVKYQKLCENFKRCGLNSPFKVKGVLPTDIIPHDCNISWAMKHHYVCTLIHLNIMYMSKQLNLPYYVVYEEDAFCLYTDVINVINKTIMSLENKDWDVLFLGYANMFHNHRGESIYSHMLDRTDMCFSLNTNDLGGAHSIIVKSTAYNKIYDLIKSEPFMVIDKLLSHTSIKTYFVNKPLFLQCNNEICFVQPHRYDVWHGSYLKMRIDGHKCPCEYNSNDIYKCFI